MSVPYFSGFQNVLRQGLFASAQEPARPHTPVPRTQWGAQCHPAPLTPCQPHPLTNQPSHRNPTSLQTVPWGQEGQSCPQLGTAVPRRQCTSGRTSISMRQFDRRREIPCHFPQTRRTRLGTENEKGVPWKKSVMWDCKDAKMRPSPDGGGRGRWHWPFVSPSEPALHGVPIEAQNGPDVLNFWDDS